MELENWVNSIHSACAAAFARHRGKTGTLHLLQEEIYRLEKAIESVSIFSLKHLDKVKDFIQGRPYFSDSYYSSTVSLQQVPNVIVVSSNYIISTINFWKKNCEIFKKLHFISTVVLISYLMRHRVLNNVNRLSTEILRTYIHSTYLLELFHFRSLSFLHFGAILESISYYAGFFT